MFARQVSLQAIKRCYVARSIPIAASIGRGGHQDCLNFAVLRSPAVAATRMITAASFSSRVTIEQAKKMPANYSELSNEVLLTLSAANDQEANEERLIRAIMAADNISWEQAQPTFIKVVESNRKGLSLATLPYKIGIFTAVVGGFASIPMIFDLDTVLWFNEHFVTTDVPDDKDLETPLEVGGWAWNWMEPPLGQISFFLLCMQYSRSQMQNLGVKPYTEWFLNRRAERLSKEFPRYNKVALQTFSLGDPLTPGDVHDHV